MGIFGAMTTAITGLRGQSTALEHISNNIANSQTTGYKRLETSFRDLVPDSSPDTQALGVVQALSRATNGVQGDIQNSDVDTFMSINGDGYFIIAAQTGLVDGLPAFDGGSLYTRRGDFELDRNGYLVNGAGYFLKGLPIDPTTGNVTGSLPDVIRVTNDFLPAEATTEISYRANLAKFPLSAQADPNVPGSELLNPASFANDPTTAGAGFVQAVDVTTFIDQTISGGAITAFTQSGEAVDVQLRWGKIQNGDPGVPQNDIWNLFYLEDTAATGANPAWRNVGQDYSFGTNGQLSPALPTVTVTNLTVNNVNLGNIVLNHGTDGMTQFADASGVVRVNEIRQNGSAAGQFSNVSISDDGRVVASFTNGRTLEIAEVTLADFNADRYLKRLDGGALQATIESGEPILGGQGRVNGSSFELSNTDIADEFSKLIVTQQAYAANTRIISTSDEMIQEALNMIR